MRSISKRTVAGIIGVTAISTALVSGCTASSTGGDATATSAASTTAAAAVPAPGQDIVNDPKARTAVSMKSCKESDSGWGASGSVTNPHDKTTTYTIVVSFTTDQSTVLARGTTKVTVDAGKTKDWTANANFANIKNVQCVLRGVSEG